MDMMNVIESWNQIKNGEWEKPKNLYSRTTQSKKTATIFSLRTITLQVIKYFKLSLCFTKKHFIVSMKTHWRYWQQILSNKMAWFHVSRYYFNLSPSYLFQPFTDAHFISTLNQTNNLQTMNLLLITFAFLSFAIYV